MTDLNYDIFLAFGALLFLGAGSCWWYVAREPGGDWQPRAAMLTAAACLWIASVLVKLILRD
jgi:hypothetical protein